MNNEKLYEMLSELGLAVVNNHGVWKGNSCNVKQWPVFRSWVNKSGKVTIKSRGVQKSFEIENVSELWQQLAGFEIV